MQQIVEWLLMIPMQALHMQKNKVTKITRTSFSTKSSGKKTQNDNGLNGV